MSSRKTSSASELDLDAFHKGASGLVRSIYLALKCDSRDEIVASLRNLGLPASFKEALHGFEEGHFCLNPGCPSAADLRDPVRLAAVAAKLKLDTLEELIASEGPLADQKWGSILAAGQELNEAALELFGTINRRLTSLRSAASKQRQSTKADRRKR